MPSINDHVISIWNQIAIIEFAAFWRLPPEIYRGLLLPTYSLTHQREWEKKKTFETPIPWESFSKVKRHLWLFFLLLFFFFIHLDTFFFNTSTHNELYQTYQQASSSCPCFFSVDSPCSVSCPKPRSNPGTDMRARWCSQYSSLKYAVPTICESPSSLYSFTEEELMFKDTGKFPMCGSPHLMLVCYV